MALKLNGKDDRLNAQNFLALSRTTGLTTGDARVAITELAARLAERAVTLRLPDFAGQAEAAKSVQEKVIAIVGERSAAIVG
jgi:serine/threonine-protein kinase HipA